MVGTSREPREVGEERTELHRHRNFQLCFDRCENTEVVRLHVFAANVRIARDRVDVQLERISSRFLDLPRVCEPSTERGAVEARDNWDIHGILRLRNVLQIGFRANLELWPDGKITERLRVRIRALLEVKLQVVLIALNLLFE